MGYSTLIKFCVCIILISLLSCNDKKDSLGLDNIPKSKIEQVNSEIWRRFVDKHGIIIDYTDYQGTVFYPTPEECQQNKINGLGWWTPIENGAMFTGLYMDGAIMRWKKSLLPSDAENVRKLANGLMLLASVSSVDGFVARGLATDDVSHYKMSSNDQAGGWFYGLWRYLETDLPTNAERKQIEEKLVQAANALVKNKWLIPAEPPFTFRGGFNGFNHNGARLLFVAKIAYKITDDEYWNKIYLDALNETGGNPKRSRLKIISEGLPYVNNKTSTWDESPSVACMRTLWEIEEDPTIKEALRSGLEISATNAMKSLALAANYPTVDTAVYDIDWRKMNEFWRPQATQADVVDVANQQIRSFRKRVTRFDIENKYVREPLFAAWVVSLGPNEAILKQRKPELQALLEKYEYKKMYTVWFFPAEAAWWRISGL